MKGRVKMHNPNVAAIVAAVVILAFWLGVTFGRQTAQQTDAIGELQAWWFAQSPRYQQGNSIDMNAREAATYDLIQRIGPILQRLEPGITHCRRCGWPSTLVLMHTTAFERGSGMSPVCESCWVRERSHAGGADRLRAAYRSLWELWQAQGSDVPWPVIERALEHDLKREPDRWYDAEPPDDSKGGYEDERPPLDRAVTVNWK